MIYNHIKYQDKSKTIIILSQNKECVIDTKDFKKIKNYRWYARKTKAIYYALTHIKINDKYHSMLMHRLILNVNDPKISIDHKDLNGLNNRRSNIRICTNSENQLNKSIQRNNTSTYKGVNFIKNSKMLKKWRSRITIDKKRIHLGYFDTAEEAAIAYNKAVIKHNKDFARVNTIKSR